METPRIQNTCTEYPLFCTKLIRAEEKQAQRSLQRARIGESGMPFPGDPDPAEEETPIEANYPL